MDTVEKPRRVSKKEFERTRFGLVSGCFLLSGFAGLVYETVWLRQFASIFGTSEAALGAVLAAYMGGLALGAAIAARRVASIRRPLLVYGILELGVAVGALAVPYGLQAAESLRVLFLGGQAELPAAGGIIEVLTDTALAFSLILVPTACMGATLPMLARHATRGSRDDAVPVGWLYGINTFGAVLGTLCAAFVLLPWLGLRGTTFVGVAINLVVFLFAIGIQRLANTGQGADEVHPDAVSASVPSTRTHAHRPAARILGLSGLLALASASSFVYEVLWTRLLGQVLGGSLYSFATMLAAFLTGIAIGSCLASRLIARGFTASRVFVMSQLLTALCTLVAFAGVDFIPKVGEWVGAGLSGGVAANVGLCLLVLLPSTIAIGMSLPLAIQIATLRGFDTSRVTGRFYAASTVGAIVGALLAGHVLLPRIGFTGTVALAAFINILVAACIIPVCRRVGRGRSDVTERMPTGLRVSLAAAPLIAVLLLSVGGPEAILRHVPLWDGPVPGRIMYSAAGASSNVMLIQGEKEFELFTGGSLESALAPKGAVGGAEMYQRWLGALPVLARPKSRSMLLVGFGGGNAVAGVPATVKSIDAVELEPKVIDALETVAHLRLQNPLDDPRVNIVFNDARGALSLTTKQYDIIVSQPSHPWSAGASHLYTWEFLSLVKARLKEGGVLLQWMNTNFVDEELLKSLGATLLDVFANVRIYHPLPTHVLLLAADSPLDVEEQIARTGQPLDSSFESMTWLGISELHDVAASLALEHEGVVRFCGGAPLITDNDNRLATRSSRLSGKTIGERSETIFQSYDALVDHDGKPSLISRLKLDPARIVRRLIITEQGDRALYVIESLENRVDRLVAEGFMAAYSGRQEIAERQLTRALEIDPCHRGARFKLLEMFLPQVAAGGGPVIFRSENLDRLEAVLVEAAACYQRKDWEGLRRLDGRLATASPGGVEEPMAQTFRALWRTSQMNTDQRFELGREAIDLIDRVMAVQRAVLPGVIRLRASEQADEMAAWLESAYQLTRLVESLDRISTQRAMIVGQSDHILSTLDSIEPETYWIKDRVELLKSRFEKMREDVHPGK